MLSLTTVKRHVHIGQRLTQQMGLPTSEQLQQQEVWALWAYRLTPVAHQAAARHRHMNYTRRKRFKPSNEVQFCIGIWTGFQ